MRRAETNDQVAARVVLRRGRQVIAIACLLVTATMPARAGLKETLERLGLFQGLQVSGSNTLTLQGNVVEGSEISFRTQRWDTGALQRQSALHIEGPIWKEFGFQADISASGFGQSYSRWVVGYVGSNTALYYGDLGINLMGNQFASFSKSLQGWQLDQKLPGGGLARAFYSREKGFTRTDVIQGNNSVGPYFLRYTPVIEGSERVKVDEEPLRFGQDYRLDYETGQLLFEPVNGPVRIIPSTSVITVAYESSGYYDTAGDLYGLRAEIPLMQNRLRVGVTQLTQARPGGGSDTVGYKEDVYNGSGSVGPFDTNFRPIIANGSTVVYGGRSQVIERALVVLVDGVEQIENVDYDAYRNIGRVIFRRAVPPTALVRIRYYHTIESTRTGGDRTVRGMDLTYRISDGLLLRADLAGSAVEGGDSGTAFSAQLQYTRPGFSAITAWRSVPTSFSYIDTAGFFRNEQGLMNRLTWQVNRNVTITNNYSRMKTAQGQSFGYSGYTGYAGLSSLAARASQSGTTRSGLDIDAARNDINVSVRYEGWPELILSNQRMTNSGGARGESDYDRTSLALAWSRGAGLQFRASLNRTNQSYLRLTEGGAADRRGSSTTSTDASLVYTPSTSLSLSADIGVNDSAAIDSDLRSDSRTVRLAAAWTPSDRLTLRADRYVSTATGRVSSGFYDSAAGGYAFQAGRGDDASARYEDANSRLGISYRPFANAFIDLSLGDRTYTSGGGAGYLADSHQTYRNLTLTWAASPALTFTSTLGRDRLEFLEQGRGTVSSNILTFSANYAPPAQPWAIGLTLNKQTGESPTYIGFGERQRALIVPTDLFDLSGNLVYKLSDDMRIYAEAGIADFDSGYSAFRKATSNVGVSYRVSPTSTVDLGYRFIKNIAGEPAIPLYSAADAQDYLAHTFMVRVQTNFSGGLGAGSRFQPRSSFGSGGYGGYGGYGEYGRTGQMGQYGGYGSFGGLGGLGGFGGASSSTFGGYQTGLGRSGQYGYGETYGSFGPFDSSGSGSGFPGDVSRLPGAGSRTGQYGQTGGYDEAGFGYGQPGGGFTTGLGQFEQAPGAQGQVLGPFAAGAAPPAQGWPATAAGQWGWWDLLDKASRWETPETAGLWPPGAAGE